MTSLAFRYESETHTYWLGSEKLPSVTGIMKKFGLYPAFDYATDEHVWRGKAIHEMMHYHHKGTLDTTKLDEALVPYHKGYLKFQGETGFKPLGWERPMAHSLLKYGGTPDLWGLCGPEIWIIDYKHGIPQRETALQLAGYEPILISNGLINEKGRPIKRMGLQLKATGDYKLEPFNDPNDLNIWIMMISVYNWGKNNVKSYT